MSARAVVCQNVTRAGWLDDKSFGCPTQVTEDLLNRFRAPDTAGSASLVASLPWWLRDLSLAVVLGLVMGGVFFTIVPRSETAAPLPAQAAEQSRHPATPPVTRAKNAAATSVVPSGGSTMPASPAISTSRLRARLRLLARRAAGIGQYRGPYRRLLRKGWRLLGRGRYQEAAVTFGRAVHTYPTRTTGYYGLALSLFEQGHEDAALAVLEQAQKRVGPKSDIWVLAGSAYQFLGREKMARKMYRLYLEKNPRGPYTHDVKIILSYDKLPHLLGD